MTEILINGKALPLGAKCLALALMAMVTGLGPAAVRAAEKTVSAVPPVTIWKTDQWDITARSNGRTYRIFVARPEALPPKEGYPVFYVLDGSILFGTATDASRMMSGRGVRKPALIVGIGYPEDYADGPPPPCALRMMDLTLPLPGATPGLPPDKCGGGSDAFYRFLTEELQRKISATYTVNRADASIFGCSAGGLFVLDTLFQHPQTFHNYIACSPAVWWRDWWRSDVVLANEAAFLAAVTKHQVAPRVLMVIGGREEAPLPLAHLQPGDLKNFPGDSLESRYEAYKKWLADLQGVEKTKALAEHLSKVDGPDGYTVQFHLYEDDDHSSTGFAAMTRALDFALRP
jgi:predicted alpha/beta superfamily hydrolase